MNLFYVDLSTIFWDVTQCCSVNKFQRCRRTYCLYLQSGTTIYSVTVTAGSSETAVLVCQNTLHHIPQNSNLHTTENFTLQSKGLQNVGCPLSRVLFIYLFIHSSVCYKYVYSTWTSKACLKTKKQCSITNSFTRFTLSSVKPITMIGQLHKCEYYNRIKIIFLF
jgi:hypothetical protein